MNGGMQVALTLDDAPSIAERAPIRFDAARMDALRERLQQARVPSCVAFVVGELAGGHDAVLQRWLQAGYALGNHSDDHAAASQVGPERFLDSVRRCDERLRALGAFAGDRARYFRFPFADRGADPAARARIVAEVEALGYRIADVSISFYDYCYEEPLQRAILAGDHARVAKVEARALHSVRVAFERARLHGPQRFGQEHVHIATGHFGAIAPRILPSLIAGLARDVTWVDLERAASSSSYRQFLADHHSNGILADRLREDLAHRVQRKLARLSRRLDTLQEDLLGPRWPHLAP